MAHKRDQTGGPNDSRMSSIPIPASAMKQSQQLPPGSSRQPTTTRSNGPRKSNFGLPSVIQRAPTASTRSQPPPGAPHLSGSMRADYGKTPVKPVGSSSMSGAGSINRRSVGGGGGIRPSRPGLPYTSAVTKEVRPIRDKAYQHKEQREILEYLTGIEVQNKIPTLSMKTLQSPTAREFFDIWLILVNELDPDYTFPPNKKIEDEFQQVMKDLLYPHAEQITRTSLAAPNTPHAWPAILASLHWMVQTIQVLYFVYCLSDYDDDISCQIRDLWLSSDDPYLKQIEDLEIGLPELPDILEFDFLAKSYHKFWNGEDSNFEDEKQELVDRYSALEFTHDLFTSDPYWMCARPTY